MPEIEFKFRVEEPGLLDRLAEADPIGTFRVASRKSVEQTDEYWDTPAGAASAANVSIRRRTTDDGCEFTVKRGKVEGGFSRRLEIQEPCGEATLIQWLQGLIEEERVVLPFSPADLAPKLSVRNRRTALHLTHDSGAEVELALDRVTFVGARGEACELELEGELLTGDESALHELRYWLSTQPGLNPSTGSKFNRALELVG